MHLQKLATVILQNALSIIMTLDHHLFHTLLLLTKELMVKGLQQGVHAHGIH